MASPKESEMSLTNKYIQITAVVSSYWFISITMVFVNKHILSDVQLNAPLFITFFQCLCSCIICTLISFISQINGNAFAIPSVNLNPHTMKSVMPLSIMFVSMITFNNLCLKYVGVAFYFVGRSLTTVFNVILSYAILGERTSPSAIVCCIIIILGFFLGVDQENASGSLSLIGVLYGVLASLSVSLNAIYTKSVLPSVNNSIWALTYYNNINAILLFVPLMVFTGELHEVLGFVHLGDVMFWNLLTLSGVFGFLIGFITGLQIKVTSPLTHNISGTAKACVQTVLAVVWYNELKSIMWWFSNVMVIFGSAAYTRIRQLEMKRNHENHSKQCDDIESQKLIKHNT